jgi:hypothetical protein
MAFDLKKAAEVSTREEEGRAVQLVDETGAPMDGVSITVVGSYSKRYRDAVDSRANRKFRLGKVPTSADIRAETLHLYADCVVSWDGFVDGGKPYACTRENVVKVFEAAPWIYEQVAQAVEDHAGFTKASTN